MALYDFDDPQAPFNKDLLYRMTLTTPKGEKRIYYFAESEMEELKHGIRDCLRDRDLAGADAAVYHDEADRDSRTEDDYWRLLSFYKSHEGEFTLNLDDDDFDMIKMPVSLEQTKTLFRVVNQIWTKTQPYDKKNKLESNGYIVNFQRNFGNRKWEPYNDLTYWDMDI